MNKIVGVVGPTGVGKSWLALSLAQVFNGEIVGADSRQIYRRLDIGTAKPGRQDLSLVPHHLIDIVEPGEDFSLTQYQQLAYQAINDILHRGKLPLLVGGSGLYVWAVLDGWRIPEVPPDPEFRRRWEEAAAGGEEEGLYRELVRVDPVSAQNIDRRNLRRMIRALEVSIGTGVPFSSLQRKEKPPFDCLILGLTAERSRLYQMNDSRVDRMIEQGLVDEVESLAESGYDYDRLAACGIGYGQIGAYLKGEMTLPEAVQQIKYETHRFVRHQYSWFRMRDERIHWFDVEKAPGPEIEKLVAGYLSG